MRRNIPLLIICLALTIASHCSYSTSKFDSWGDKNPSFNITVAYDASTQKVTISWDDSDKSDYRYDIFRTKNPNDEYADYEFVASASSSPYIDDVWGDKGIYYYRVAKYDIFKGTNPSVEYEEFSSAAMVNLQP